MNDGIDSPGNLAEFKQALTFFFSSREAMTGHHATREAKPAPGPRVWKSKRHEVQQVPSLKPDWKRIVAEGKAAGLVRFNQPPKP